jgi:hypothetical protein
MRKLTNYLLTLTVIGSLIAINACNESSDPKPVPTVTVPSSIITVESGGTGTATFGVSVASGLTATWTATGVNCTVGESSGTVSGSSVAVPFTAGSSAGAAAVNLTITDSDNRTASGTAPISVLAPGDSPITFNTNGSIPATASVVVGQTLAIDGVDVASADGVLQVTVTVNGDAVTELDSVYTGAPTSAEYGFSVNTGTLGQGTYNIVFTAEDVNGSTTSFSHALTVAPLSFNVVEETDNDGNVISREVSGSINSDYTFTNDAEWILAGRVKVTAGATLTIEAGSVLKGRTGQGQNSTALLVTRGSKLMAEGTATAPIIMTSISDDLSVADVAGGDFIGSIADDVAGLWGGLIVLGNAPISTTNENDEDVAEAQIEGIPSSDPDGLYGGTNKEDNSGVIKYLSIRHGGTNIGSGNEINGLTLGGVGSGTVIENVEIVANADDGIEWFGGTVSITGALVWNSFDDALDTDQAWNGTVSNFIVVTPITGSGMELDGPEGSYIDGRHTITNGIVYAGAAIDLLVDFDENTNVDVTNVYFYGITTGTTVTDYAKMRDAGNGSVSGWQYSDLTNPADVFVDIESDKLTSVATNQNTVGPQSQAGFEWTWASQSGALTGIGIPE